MRSINYLHWSAIGYVVIVLNGCASFDAPNDENNRQNESVEPSNASSSVEGQSTSEILPELTPFEQEVMALRQQPNLYLSGSPVVSQPVSDDYNAALALKKNAQWQDAQQAFSALTKQYPKLSGSFVQLGDIALESAGEISYVGASSQQYSKKMSLLAEAKMQYLGALKSNELNYFAHNRLARVYREMGQFDEAEKHYLRALEIFPAHSQSHLNLGILYDLYLQNKAQALHRYKIYQALQDKPVRQVRGWIADLSRQLARQNQ